MVERALNEMVESGEIGMSSSLRRRMRDQGQSLRSVWERFIALSGMTFVIAFVFGFITAKSPRSLFAVYTVDAVAIALACGFATWTDRGSAAFRRIHNAARGLLRGGVLGLSVWLGTMLFAGMFGDFGDKFLILVIAMIPFAAAFGGFAGSILALAIRPRSSSSEVGRTTL